MTQQPATKLLLFAGATALASLATPTLAESSSDSLINKLEQKGILSADEAKQLRSESAASDTNLLNQLPASKWKIADSIKTLGLYGDLRFRYEYRGVDNTIGASPDTYYRERMRYALRFGLKGDLVDDFSYGVRLETLRKMAPDAELPRKDGFHALGNALEQDSFGRNLTTLLRYGDRNSMAHSREVRLPFCDHRVAEFALRQAPQILMGEVQTKRLLRESMRGILPEAIRARWNKQGFRPPQDLWFKSPRMLGLARDIFSSNSFRHSDHWIPSWWMRTLDRVEQGELALGWTIWHPMMIELWKKHFLERVGAATSASKKSESGK